MARPEKLTQRQKDEIGGRLARGESMGKLAKEFRIGKTTISRLFSGRPETIRALAKSLANTELEISRLPVPEQYSVRSLADQLKAITSHALDGAESGMRVSARLLALADRTSETLQGETLLTGANLANLQLIAAAAETANKAATLGLGMMNANRKSNDVGTPTLESLVTGEQK